MPRLNNSSEFFKSVTSVKIFRAKTGTFGSTTLSSLAAYGATSLTVAATTNFADNDHLIINGSGGVELNQIDGAPTSSSIPLEWKLQFAQGSGATVIEAQEIDLGKVAQGGVTLSSSFSQQGIFSAQDTTAVAFFAGEGEISFNFGLLGFNGLNLQLAFGAPELEQGAGTTADPYIAGIKGTDIATLGVNIVRFTGTRFDDAAFALDFNDVKIEGGGSVTFGRQTATEIPIAGKCTSIVLRHPVV